MHHLLVRRLVALAAVALAVGPAGAQTRRVRPAGDHFVVRCRLLVNPATGQALSNAAIEVSNGRILRVAPATAFRPPAGVRVLDFSDKVVIPGLIDVHGHLYSGVITRHTTSDVMPPFFLAAGVTTVQSPGSMDPDGDLALQDRIDSGKFIGPRYFHSGEYIEADPVSVRWMQPVTTPEEVRLKVDHWASRGATSIKIYAKMSGDLLRAAVDQAHEHGLKLYAHIGAVTYREAIEAGVDQLFHGALTLGDARPPGVDEKAQQNSAGWMAQMDLGAPAVTEMLALAAQAKTVLTPTAVVIEPSDPVKHHLAEQKKYFTPEALSALEKRWQQPIVPGAAEGVRKNLEFIKRASDAGCLLATGTDIIIFSMLPGYSLWREMELFAEAGLKPMEILKAATINGAFALGRSDLLGSVEAGKLADFVILDANPLDTISNVRLVHRVVKGGVVYDPAELLKPLEGRIH